VSGVAGPQAYHRVIDVIAAFDRLARAEHAVERRRSEPPVAAAGGRGFGLNRSAGLDLPAA
jgi:hypothetical protein